MQNREPDYAESIAATGTALPKGFSLARGGHPDIAEALVRQGLRDCDSARSLGELKRWFAANCWSSRRPAAFQCQTEGRRS